MRSGKLIMVADDEPMVHETLKLYLSRDGYDMVSVYRGDQVLQAFRRLRPDLVILDVMMPGRSGTEVCSDIRRESMTPVILLTARGEETDRLLGFALGADDYIVKPFSPRELVSRIQVIFRRLNSLQVAPQGGTLKVGNTVLDLRSYDVRVDGEKITFSPKEVEILHLMASQLGQVFTREQLLDSIWGFDFDGDSRVVDTSVKRIRKKLPPQSTLSIVSVYGVGYKAEGRV